MRLPQGTNGSRLGLLLFRLCNKFVVGVDSRDTDHVRWREAGHRAVPVPTRSCGKRERSRAFMVCGQ